MTDLTDCAGRATAPSFGAKSHFSLMLGHVAGVLRLWQSRARQRTELVELPPHLLFDIGLTCADVEEEARKLPWERPSLRNFFRRRLSEPSRRRPHAQDQ